ncbi:hypothetical protein SAMN04489835_4688 [Mycolicibacterium rutilum]|uniref:Uncharacterized protein n=1 Tax=Mycolicibacterium rutilum TaxID=370526 RepID=A0A1H6LDW4_MYCRU|nr:hypothetical protein SAMN04489835_4688 [Mycolicibacterium rutilum]
MGSGCCTAGAAGDDGVAGRGGVACDPKGTAGCRCAMGSGCCTAGAAGDDGVAGRGGVACDPKGTAGCRCAMGSGCCTAGAAGDDGVAGRGGVACDPKGTAGCRCAMGLGCCTAGAAGDDGVAGRGGVACDPKGTAGCRCAMGLGCCTAGAAGDDGVAGRGGVACDPKGTAGCRCAMGSGCCTGGASWFGLVVHRWRRLGGGLHVADAYEALLERERAHSADAQRLWINPDDHSQGFFERSTVLLKALEAGKEVVVHVWFLGGRSVRCNETFRTYKRRLTPRPRHWVVAPDDVIRPAPGGVRMGFPGGSSADDEGQFHLDKAGR